MTNEELAAKVFSFLDQHAKEAADYDPKYDEPRERFNGPDSSLMFAAAILLAQGLRPMRVHSDYGSGCYRPWPDATKKIIHDELVREINQRCF